MEGMNQLPPVEIGADVKEAPLDLKKEKKFCSGMGLSYFLFFIVTSAVQMLVTSCVMVLRPDILTDHYSLYMLLAMAPIYVIGFPVLYLITRKKKTYKPEDHKMTFGNFMIVLLMCFGVMIVGNIIGILVTLLIGFLKGTPLVNPLDSLLGQSSLPMNILLAGICAPIFEELMFRKILVDRFVRYGQATAVIMSGLMFGLFHGNFTQFFYATFLGFLFAYIYAKTGRIHYTIFLHMIINMSSTLMMPVLQKIDLTHLENIAESYQNLLLSGNMSEAEIMGIAGDLGPVIVPFMILILYEVVVYAMAVAGIVLLIIRRKRFTFQQGPVQLPEGKRFSTLWLNAGMIIYFITCLVMFAVSILRA